MAGLRRFISRRLARAEQALEVRAENRRQQAAQRQRAFRQRAYAAAAINRLTADWKYPETTADVEIYKALRILRGRSRELFRNDDYIRRFSHLMKTNVLGHEGIRLQSRAEDAPGQLDKEACRTIERAWADWCRRQVCSACGTLSLWRMANMVLDAWAADGEVLVQKFYGWADNKYGFAVRLLEADHLDLEKNEQLPGGNTIIMGVEKNSYGRPVAYWLRPKHPGDTSSIHSNSSVRVPVNQILHIYEPERAGQTRGVPLIITAMRRLRQLGAYEEAELIAARVAASKMGFFKPTGGSDFGEAGFDENGNIVEPGTTDVDLVTEATPGTFEQLPEGMDFISWNPEHPSSAFESFGKAVLRGAASGLNVSYVALSNNLEGVSYSSIRSGEMSDRDAWKMLQRWIVENFYAPLFEDWLVAALTTGALPLPAAKIEKWRNVRWKPRGWKWVDPIKESKANENDVANCFASLFDVAAERGYDLEEIIEENARARELAEEHGLKLPVFNGVNKNLPEKDDDDEPDQATATEN